MGRGIRRDQPRGIHLLQISLHFLDQFFFELNEALFFQILLDEVAMRFTAEVI